MQVMQYLNPIAHIESFKKDLEFAKSKGLSISSEAIMANGFKIAFKSLTLIAVLGATGFTAAYILGNVLPLAAIAFAGVAALSMILAFAAELAKSRFIEIKVSGIRAPIYDIEQQMLDRTLAEHDVIFPPVHQARCISPGIVNLDLFDSFLSSSDPSGSSIN